MPRLRVRRRDTDEERAELAGYAAAAVAEVEAALDVPPDLSAAAFFDVDNTMIMGASLYYFAKGLAARNYFTSRDVASFIWQQAKFRIAGTENPDDVMTIRDNALAFVAGRTVAEIVEAGEEIYEESMADRIWTGTRALAQQHLDSGQRVWLITATPIELASLISTRLGLTGALGTVSEIEDGIYTGRLVGEPMHGEAKAVAVRALAEREGLDLQRCAAYSDSANDVPMLSMVGRPVAVNPDSELKAIARARGWEVRDFRTGRKAARVGLPTALIVGMVAGAVAAAIAVRRRYRF